VTPKKEATTPAQPAAPEQAVVPVPSTPAVKPMDSIFSEINLAKNDQKVKKESSVKTSVPTI
jgi:hypothetical protein